MDRHQRKELQGYVARPTTFFRASLFMLAVGLTGLVSRSVAHRAPLIPDGSWLLAPIAVGLLLLRSARNWTGGSDFRRRVRQDLAGGVAAVRRVSAVDAIEVEEAEDEGPAYFILTRDGQTLHVAFQELARYKTRGFPWTEFEFIEAPQSGTFFAIKKIGEKLEPLQVLPPRTWSDLKRLGGFNKHYQVLDIEFEKLKEGSPEVAAIPGGTGPQ
jgi:hypothetical protein